MRGILVAVFLLVHILGMARDADQDVAAGRAYLAAHDLTNANNKFVSALAQSPLHTNANVFRAATRLLTLQDRPAGKALLDRLGVAAGGRSLYDWTADVPRDTNGLPSAPANFSVAELNSFARTNLLPEIIAAETNLAVVTDTNYTLDLASNETTTVSVTLDYGDILLLRAGLGFAEYAGYAICSWNTDLQLAAIRSLFTNGPATAQSFLAQYPSLLKFATTNDLAAARQAFTNATALYLRASAYIRNRPANQVRLFNYDPRRIDSEADFRTLLTELNQSLAGPVALSSAPRLAVDLRNHFSGARSPRDVLPRVSRNSIVAGTLPDPTFGGLVQGLQPYEIERALGRRVPFVSNFAVPQPLPGGGFRISLDALDGSMFIVQSSTDLQTWADLTSGVAQQGVLSFTHSNAATISKRFYRAVDRSGSVSVSGSVYNIATGNPIGGATAALWVPFTGWGFTNQTDGAGNFSILSDPAFTDYYELQVSAAGYAPLFVTGYLPDDQHLAQPFYLAPLGYQPANDNFAQRQTLSGTTLTANGSNVGATYEPGEPLLGAGLSVWYTWTATASGAVTLDTVGSSSSPFLGVYTGTVLASLARVTSNEGRSDSSLNFFVTAGTAYQIVVDANYLGIGGRIVLNLRMTPPLGPAITTQPRSRTVAAGGSIAFHVSATGTAPLRYQWRRNGANLSGATGADYYLDGVQTNAAGLYTVVVTNAAGTVTSSNALLTVATIPPRIKLQPVSQLVGLGDAVSFEVQAVGAPEPFYQWRKGGVPIANATNDFFIITNAQAASAGTYSVMISNLAGVALSSNALLTVITTPPFNDAFSNRILIPGLTNTVLGSNFVASKELNEPDHAGNTGGRSVWWTWTAPTNGPVTFDTSGSSFDTLLAIYTGTEVTNLNEVASDDDGGPGLTSQASFYAVQGSSYQIAVDGSGGVSGTIKLALSVGGVQTGGPGVRFTVLHTFHGPDGVASYGELIQGRDGRLYGTASQGGTADVGVVFSLEPNGGSFTNLRSFTTVANSTNSDGAFPGTGLMQGSDGRLYGTTWAGGTNGTGTLFSIGTNGGFAVLHTFRAFPSGANTNADGNSPAGSLIEGRDGRLYGAATYGGESGIGTLFALTTNGSGFVVLHTFGSPGPLPGGAYPGGALLQAADGRLYGTAAVGGFAGDGTVFALAPDGGDFTVLHTFQGSSDPKDGSGPAGALVQGRDGRLYGTTTYGGAWGNGIVFCLQTNGTGFTVLHAFGPGDPATSANLEGMFPYAGLRQGSDGRLYGTANSGGANGAGTLFSLSNVGTEFILLHVFAPLDLNAEGAGPSSALIQGRDGRFYGNAPYGGTNDVGTLFALAASPPALAIARVPNRAVLSWPAWATDYVLETSGAAFAASWVPVTNNPSLTGDFFVLTNTVNTSPIYFRLHKQ